MRITITLVVFIAALAGANPAAEAGRGKKKHKRVKGQTTASCLRALKAYGVKYRRARRRGIAIAVRVRGRLGGVRYVSYNRKPLILDCSLVVSLAAAGPFFTRHGIDEATFSSAYQVRKIRGTSRPSRHSFGLAIDVHEFRGSPEGSLGLLLKVKDDYEQGLGDSADCLGKPLTAGGLILRTIDCQLRRSGLFKNIIDPDYNADHYNHFHVSARPWRERADKPVERLKAHRAAAK